MNIDWNELTQGFQQEMEKSAAWDISAGKKLIPWATGAGAVGVGVKGVGVAQDALKGVGSFVDSAKTWAPIGLAALFGMGGAGGAKQQGGGVVNNYLSSKLNPSYLTPDPGTVSSISSPRAYASSVKQADAIFDMLGDTVKRRIANSVVNEITKTNPLGMRIADNAEASASGPHPSEVELTSKYPEMQELLKDEKNKAYLRKLLQR
jgi:hypothetical protein